MSSLAVVVVVIGALLSGCPPDEPDDDDRTYQEKCDSYCTVIEKCDSEQFYENFPSVAQCITNCTFSISGGEGLTPACRAATEDTVVCIGDLTCTEFDSPGPCPDQHLAQEAACNTQ